MNFPNNIRARVIAACAIIRDAESYYRGIKAKEEEALSSLQNTQQKIIFLNVGLAISYWGKMEEELVVIAALLLRVPNEKAGLMMYSVLNFNSWLEIINDLFEMDDTLQPFREKWTKIAKRIRAIKDKRDQLAHHPIESDSTAIKASILDIRRKTKGQSVLGTQQILQFHEAIFKIINDLVPLVAAMNAALVDASTNKFPE